MFSVSCPYCGQSQTYPLAESGKSVECTQCRGMFVARQLTSLEEPVPELPKSDGSKFAVGAFVFGGIAWITCLCFGMGALFGFIGLFLGMMGLQSRLRSLSIVGMMLSLSGLIFSICVFVLIVFAGAAAAPDAVPNPRGNAAPFVER